MWSQDVYLVYIQYHPLFNTVLVVVQLVIFVSCQLWGVRTLPMAIFCVFVFAQEGNKTVIILYGQKIVDHNGIEPRPPPYKQTAQPLSYSTGLDSCCRQLLYLNEYFA